jgi:ABC-type glycerol-3-phosphate transport system substrate-binding protein
MRLYRLTAAAVLGTSALALAACGGGSSDKDQLTDLIKKVGNDPAYLCDHMSAKVDTAIGGKDGCLKAAKADGAKDPDIKIDSITIDGDSASAKITGNKGPDTVKFVKEDGDWKVDA